MVEIDQLIGEKLVYIRTEVYVCKMDSETECCTRSGHVISALKLVLYR